MHAGISAGRARTFFEISAGLLELAVTTVEEDFLEQHDRAQLSALADVQQYGNIECVHSASLCLLLFFACFLFISVSVFSSI